MQRTKYFAVADGMSLHGRVYPASRPGPLASLPQTASVRSDDPVEGMDCWTAFAGGV